MIIDLRTFKQKGLSEGNFDFDYNPDNSILQIPSAGFLNGAKVVGSFIIEGKDVRVYGEVKFTIKGECSRCLETAQADVCLNFDEKFSIFKNDECYIYSKDRVCLTQMVDDLILSDAPLCIYCKPDCKGLCPVCGHNLNISDCGCTNNL